MRPLPAPAPVFAANDPDLRPQDQPGGFRPYLVDWLIAHERMGALRRQRAHLRESKRR